MRGTYRASFLELLARSEAFFLHGMGTNSVMITTTIGDSANRQEMGRAKMRRGERPPGGPAYSNRTPGQYILSSKDDLEVLEKGVRDRPKANSGQSRRGQQCRYLRRHRRTPSRNRFAVCATVTHDHDCDQADYFCDSARQKCLRAEKEKNGKKNGVACHPLEPRKMKMRLYTERRSLFRP
jgi:hypothetical protein